MSSTKMAGSLLWSSVFHIGAPARVKSTVLHDRAPQTEKSCDAGPRCRPGLSADKSSARRPVHETESVETSVSETSSRFDEMTHIFDDVVCLTSQRFATSSTHLLASKSLQQSRLLRTHAGSEAEADGSFATVLSAAEKDATTRRCAREVMM